MNITQAGLTEVDIDTNSILPEINDGVFNEIFDGGCDDTEWDEEGAGHEMPVACVWSLLFDFPMF